VKPWRTGCLLLSVLGMRAYGRQRDPFAMVRKQGWSSFWQVDRAASCGLGQYAHASGT